MELHIRDVSKTYRNGTQALKDVTPTIPEGMYGLLGRNGAGKSTLMRILATLQEPDSGSVRLGDIDVVRQKDRVRETLGYLPQSDLRSVPVLHHVLGHCRGRRWRRCGEGECAAAGGAGHGAVRRRVRDAGVGRAVRRCGDARHRGGRQTIRVTTPREPARVGIDPFRKLIEREREDNVIEVKCCGTTEP